MGYIHVVNGGGDDDEEEDDNDDDAQESPVFEHRFDTFQRRSYNQVIERVFMSQTLPYNSPNNMDMDMSVIENGQHNKCFLQEDLKEVSLYLSNQAEDLFLTPCGIPGQE